MSLKMGKALTRQLLLLQRLSSQKPGSRGNTISQKNKCPYMIKCQKSFLKLGTRVKLAGALVTILVLVILAIIAAVAYCLAKLISSKDVKGLEPTVPEASLKTVQDLKDGEQTMEKFLRDIAREKPVRFTIDQLCSFTNNYSTKLGAGGFGVVYKGQFPNGVKIAVKILNTCLNKRVEAQFMAEIGTIGRTYHINLVRLYGFCYDQRDDQTKAALVYEYMENGSLDKYLFANTEVLKWEKLHDIAIGTARGIAYLHEECNQRIIHYDIKPANVLLDAKFSAKVADFGLAKLCNPENTHDSTSGYRGTPGYSAPEFFLRNYPITHKCDVYSFGMLLFEIIGRRKNAQDCSSDTLDWFPKQVWDEYEKGELAAKVLGCGIEENNGEEAERMSMVALWCVQDCPEARPPMSAVVKMLEGGVEIVPPPKPFRYLYSIGMDALKSPCRIVNGSSHLASEGTQAQGGESFWYQESSPIIAKYGTSGFAVSSN